MVDPTQMCPSSISLLGVFQGTICNIEWLKGGPWSSELLGGPKLEGDLRTLFIPWMGLLQYWRIAGAAFFLSRSTLSDVLSIIMYVWRILQLIMLSHKIDSILQINFDLMNTPVIQKYLKVKLRSELRTKYPICSIIFKKKF